MENNPNCVICNCTDNMELFFIQCKSLDMFCKRIVETFKSVEICKSICNLKNIVLSYNLDNESFSSLWQINLIFTITGFSIEIL